MLQVRRQGPLCARLHRRAARALLLPLRSGAEQAWVLVGPAQLSPCLCCRIRQYTRCILDVPRLSSAPWPQFGHDSRDCPNSLCWRCQRPGHMARDCPYGYRQQGTWDEAGPPVCLRCGSETCPCAGEKDFVRCAPWVGAGRHRLCRSSSGE